MMDRIGELWRRLINGEDVSSDEMLWGVLLVGMLFASVHLITMMVTRWGDQQATSKSLIFSIAVHLCCGIGLLSMNVPDPPEKKVVEKKEREQPIIQVRFDGAETFETKLAGNTALFRKLPPTRQPALTRREKLPHNIEPPPTPARKQTPITPPLFHEPNIHSNPHENVAAPLPRNFANRGRLRESALPQQIRDETARRRLQAHNPSPKRTRLPVNRPAQNKLRIVREISRGATDKTSSKLRIDKRVAMLDTNRVRMSPLKNGKKPPLIRKRISPAPSNSNAPNPGLTARRTNAGTAGNNPQPKRIPLRSRRDDGVPGGGVQRFRSNLKPSSPRSTDRLLASRTGPLVRNFRNGPRPNVRRANAPRRSRRSSNLPPTYRLRSLANRKAVAEKYGGTDATEKAVEAALKWLARNQNAAGYWDADAFGSGKVGVDDRGVNRRHAGKNADTGITALSLLAFLGAGYTHEEGDYAKNVEQAVRWLVSQQRSDGFLGGNAGHYAKMYCHGMATYALAEAYGMQSDPTLDLRLRTPLRKAVAYTLNNQNSEDGGWRYLKGQRSDMSMFGWQLMALKSAQIAGLTVPLSARRKMVKFLKDHSFGPKKGLASYQQDYPVTATMTAEALFCKQMFHIPRSHPSSKEAVAYLLDRLPRRSKLNLYYWYYGTLAMYQYGGPEWKKWNDAIQGSLLPEQSKTGRNAGSWDPKGPFGSYGGRVYSTAVSALCLEVYYRFLPLYKMSGRPDEN